MTPLGQGPTAAAAAAGAAGGGAVTGSVNVDHTTDVVGDDGVDS